MLLGRLPSGMFSTTCIEPSFILGDNDNHCFVVANTTRLNMLSEAVVYLY